MFFHFGFDKRILTEKEIREIGWFRITRFLLPIHNQTRVFVF